MERSDWLLLLLGTTAEHGKTPALDRIRIMKSLFLLVEEGDLDSPPDYEFEPYHYGPVSLDVYGDLADLERTGMIESMPVPGYSWSKYQLSPTGRARYGELLAACAPEAVGATERVKNLVSSLSFRSLLKYVYSRHPQYAVNSVIGRL